MPKKLLFPFILTLAVVGVIGLFLVLFKLQNTSLADSTPIFFYGETCPHCENVEEFFVENRIEEKMTFEKLEIYNSTANAKLLADRYQKCGITDPKKMGVPLFWDGSTCINGDQPIIDYFKAKLKI